MLDVDADSRDSLGHFFCRSVLYSTHTKFIHRYPFFTPAPALLLSILTMRVPCICACGLLHDLLYMYSRLYNLAFW